VDKEIYPRDVFLWITGFTRTNTNPFEIQEIQEGMIVSAKIIGLFCVCCPVLFFFVFLCVCCVLVVFLCCCSCVFVVCSSIIIVGFVCLLCVVCWLLYVC